MLTVGGLPLSFPLMSSVASALFFWSKFTSQHRLIWAVMFLVKTHHITYGVPKLFCVGTYGTMISGKPFDDPLYCHT